ncbi:hypothetical protein [Reyranella sp.]|uniref:hypothetical protein n=1 Tax=Reyranella sp. TaxID=1929291 RepID=UPI003D0EFC17
MSATAPRRLTHSAAFRAFDDIESAQIDVQGAIELFTLLLDHGAFDKVDSTPHALERLLTADYRALEQAIAKARKMILNAVPDDHWSSSAPTTFVFSTCEGPLWPIAWRSRQIILKWTSG